MKIGITIFVMFVGFMVIGSVAAIHSFYLGSEDILKKQVYAHLETTVQSRANHIGNFLEEQREKILLIANIDILEDSLNKANLEFSENDLNNLVEELEEVLEINEDDFEEIFILNQEGIVVVSTKSEHIGKRVIGDIEFLINKSGAHISEIHYSDILNKLVIDISAKIISDETKETMGIVVAVLSSEDLNEVTLDRTGLGQTGEIYLVNKDGYMITPSRFIPEKVTFLKQKVDTINSRNCLSMKGIGIEHIEHEPIAVFEDYRGVKVLGTHAYFPEMNWCLLAEIDEAEALGELKIQLVKSALMSLTIMVLFIFLAEYVIRKIVKQKYTQRDRK